MIAIFKFYFYNVSMKFTFVNLTAVFIFLLLSLNACKNSDSTNQDLNSSNRNSNQTIITNSENTNAVRDDIDELGKIIKLPLVPEEVNYWEENSIEASGGNQDAAQIRKKMVVVLKFSPENAAQLVTHIEKIKPPIDAAIDAESQFPAELIAQSQLSGDETLKGKSYAADDFLQTPFNRGKITRIENTDYFVLELNAD